MDRGGKRKEVAVGEHDDKRAMLRRTIVIMRLSSVKHQVSCPVYRFPVGKDREREVELRQIGR